MKEKFFVKKDGDIFFVMCGRYPGPWYPFKDKLAADECCFFLNKAYRLGKFDKQREINKS